MHKHEFLYSIFNYKNITIFCYKDCIKGAKSIVKKGFLCYNNKNIL